jgi:putative membrane protein
MRFVLILLLLIVVACGALFGALNGTRVAVDFYFAQIDAPIGAALLAVLLVGWLLGGLVAWSGQVPRLRRDLRTARVRIRALEARSSTDSPDADA